MVKKCTYEVIVGNIGQVEKTKNKKRALKVFNEYKNLSKKGKGRAGGENVAVLCNGEPVAEHYGPYGDY